MKNNVVGYGLIGCGTFCVNYLSTLGPLFKNVTPVCCSDLNQAAAEKAAKDWNIPKICSSDEVIADPDVDIVLILTPPSTHYKLCMQALAAGKHVYCEKPLATSLEEINDIVDFAAKQGLFVGAAPDTFLTPKLQTVRKLIEDGAIGKVVNVTANTGGPGSELWHPNASFLYKAGGGPILDLGPYYITALVSLLGPIESLFCYGNKGKDVRKINGEDVTVDVPTNYSGVLKFADGVIGTMNMSFDEWKTTQPSIEIHGTEGVILAPNPNNLWDPVKLLRADDMRAGVDARDDMIQKIVYLYGDESFNLFHEVEPIAPVVETEHGALRGQGVADMADAIMNGGKPKVSAELCRHVTEAVNAFDVSARTGSPYTMTTTCEKPEMMKF